MMIFFLCLRRRENGPSVMKRSCVMCFTVVRIFCSWKEYPNIFITFHFCFNSWLKVPTTKPPVLHNVTVRSNHGDTLLRTILLDRHWLGQRRPWLHPLRGSWLRLYLLRSPLISLYSIISFNLIFLVHIQISLSGTLKL